MRLFVQARHRDRDHRPAHEPICKHPLDRCRPYIRARSETVATTKAIAVTSMASNTPKNGASFRILSIADMRTSNFQSVLAIS